MDHLWGIVLAGGEGTRLQEFIRKKYETERPKQYSVIIGHRSMLRHTLDRIGKIIPNKNIRIVVARSHSNYLKGEISEKEKKRVLVAPENRESAASIYLALSHINFHDPNAVVAIFPSDHFIGEEKRFLNYVEQAVSFVEKYNYYAVLLGIKPTEPSVEYGWIEQSKKFLLHEGNRFYKVVRFYEKPEIKEAQKFFNNGSLWNSLVITARCDMLIRMYQKHFKTVYDAFKKSKLNYGTDREEQFIEDAFEKIPSKNFSKCILEAIPESLFVLRAEGILWSDWGTKEQVLKDLDRLGLVH